MTFNFTADPRLVPDLDKLAAMVQNNFEELRGLAESANEKATKQDS